jgi:large repetitive protein
MNQGDGTFKDQTVAGLGGVVGVPMAFDFNLDGIADLVVLVQTSTGNQIYSFAGHGDGSFTLIGSLQGVPAAQLVVGDFDHDGFPDLAGPGAFEPAAITYLFGGGHGHFDLQKVVGPFAAYAAVGDFNGDGIPDIVMPDDFSFVTLALGRTDRNFPVITPLFPATIFGLSAGDVNGDGLPEIFAGGNREFNIPGSMFLNKGNSNFSLAASIDPAAGEIVDLTGNGVFDLGWREWTESRSLAE